MIYKIFKYHIVPKIRELSHLRLLINYSIIINLFNVFSNACTFSKTLPNEVREIRFWELAIPARDKLTCQSFLRIRERNRNSWCHDIGLSESQLNFSRSSQKSARLVTLGIEKFRLPRERSCDAKMFAIHRDWNIRNIKNIRQSERNRQLLQITRGSYRSSVRKLFCTWKITMGKEHPTGLLEEFRPRLGILFRARQTLAQTDGMNDTFATISHSALHISRCRSPSFIRVLYEKIFMWKTRRRPRGRKPVEVRSDERYGKNFQSCNFISRQEDSFLGPSRKAFRKQSFDLSETVSTTVISFYCRFAIYLLLSSRQRLREKGSFETLMQHFACDLRSTSIWYT